MLLQFSDRKSAGKYPNGFQVNISGYLGHESPV